MSCFCMKLKLFCSALLLLGFLLLIFLHPPVNLRGESSPGDLSVGVCETTNGLAPSADTQANLQRNPNLVDFLSSQRSGFCVKRVEYVLPLAVGTDSASPDALLSNVLMCCSSYKA